MSSSSQRKILEKDLRNFYLDRCLTDNEIAEKLMCTKQAVYKARRKFNINSFSRIERNSKLIKITKRQEEILRGSLLGDACVTTNGEFDITHSAKQFGYLLWLFKNLQPYFGEIRNTRTCRRIRSCTHNFGIQLRKEYYPKNIKKISEELLNKLTQLSLAVWFMDDGQVLPSGTQSRLSTCCFPKEENEIIVTYFKNIWNIKGQVRIYGGYPYIYFNKENTIKFINTIRIHVPISMRYKIRPAVRSSIYLSGGMEFKTKLGGPWRDWITKELDKLGYDAINPVKLELCKEENSDIPIQIKLSQLKLDGKLEEVRHLVRKVLFRKDMFAIQLSDAIIVYYDESVQRGAGTLSEAWEAFREGIPIYLVTDFPVEKIPTWLIGETTHIFSNFEDLLHYITEHSHVIRDQMHAQSVRDKVLDGIY